MSKAASRLLKSVGANISESLGGDGVREMLPEAGKEASIAGSVAGRSRNRQAGIVDVALVIPDPEQPRKEFTEESLQRLAESLKRRGQLQNVRVRFSAELQKYVLISGERRYRAALLAGLPTLKAEFIDRELTEAEKLEDQLVENCLREDLNGLELAQAYEKLMGLRGYTAKELAKELNVSPGAVTKTLSVLKLPEDLQEKVAEGALPRITAYEISRLPSEEEQRLLAARVIDEGLSNARIAETVQETQGRRDHARSKSGKRLSCTLPGRGSVTVAREEELTLESVIELLNELLKVAKKAKAQGRDLDALPGMLKGKTPKAKEAEESFPVENEAA